MSRDRAPRRGGMVRSFIHLGLGQIATTILTLLLNAALARALSPSDFGLLYLVTSIATFIYVIVDWGHSPLIIRETARHPEKSGDLLGSAFAVRTAFALLACVVGMATTWLLGYD
ncbi:MAG TPA: oligosaccharide flippase family protein, partial [Steroidobacteraceae bacterium]